MIVAERHLGLPGSIDVGFEEKYKVTSVGILVHVGSLVRTKK